MEQLIIVFHVLGALAITGLILMQQGKGADAGASFGGGASQTFFGGRGSGNALTRATAILATLFFATSFALAYVAKDKAQGVDDVDIPSAETVEQIPVAPVDEIPSVEENAAPSTDDIPNGEPTRDIPTAAEFENEAAPMPEAATSEAASAEQEQQGEESSDTVPQS